MRGWKSLKGPATAVNFSLNTLSFDKIKVNFDFEKKFDLCRKLSIDRIEHFVKIKYYIIVNCT